MKQNSNGSIDITLKLSWPDIQKALDKEIQEAVKNAELPGFRKGMAPKDLVLAKLDRNDLLTHSIQHVLPDYYARAIKEHNLKPILYPQLKLVSGEEGKDWEFTATTCETPTVTLPLNWQDEIKKLKPEKPDEKLTGIVEFLRSQVKIAIPDLLVEEEANHRLAALVENISKLGMDTQKYLETKKLTPETLKAQTAAEARVDLEIEFILNQIKTDQKLEDRKQTLDFLQNLV